MSLYRAPIPCQGKASLALNPMLGSLLPGRQLHGEPLSLRFLWKKPEPKGKEAWSDQAEISHSPRAIILQEWWESGPSRSLDIPEVPNRVGVGGWGCGEVGRKDLRACEHLELTCHSLFPSGATQASGGNYQSAKTLQIEGKLLTGSLTY